MTYWITFTLVFISIMFADICWAMYFHYIAKQKSIMAGCWGSMVYLTGAYSMFKIVDDFSFVIAGSAGGFIGTLITVEYNKRKNKTP